MALGDLVTTLDGLANRKGVAYLCLAAYILGIGPMAVFVGSFDLYLTLSEVKLLLLAFGLTAPPLALTAAAWLVWRRMESIDVCARRGIITSAAALGFCQGISIVYSWSMSVPGFKPFVIATAVAAILVILTQWDEHRSWRKDVDAGHLVYDDDDFKAFAEANKPQFDAWQRQRLEATTRKPVRAPE
ncbi:MAG TPA: hypothetical protein VEA16_03490 [Vicinamibacterales bacterium]|nr:hypothetical protein [Vicinamibacterales bacterium]